MVKVNTPANAAKVACRIIAAVLLAVLAAGIVACCIGCETTAPSREAVRADIAWALRIAYDAGGRDAVSNRIERLVAKGKLTREQADYLHVAAQRAYERVLDDLDPADYDTLTNALEGVSGAADEWTVCGGGDALCDGCCDDGDCCDDGGCNEDAYCGNCDACRLKK